MKKALFGYYLFMGILVNLGLNETPSARSLPWHERIAKSAIYGALWPVILPAAMIGVLISQPKDTTNGK